MNEVYFFFSLFVALLYLLVPFLLFFFLVADAVPVNGIRLIRPASIYSRPMTVSVQNNFV